VIKEILHSKMLIFKNLPSSSDGESNLGFSGDEEVSSSSGLSLGINDFFLLCSVLIVVFFSIGSELLSLFNSLLSLFISSFLELL
jgi:hypothetical protein